MLYITNAFSLNMLQDSTTLSCNKVSLREAITLFAEAGEYSPAIGHQDTAAIVAAQLGADSDLHNRISVALVEGDSMLVAQYKGPRLPEGATALPEGATIEWWVVAVA